MAFNVQTVKSDYVWTETIYIRTDGSIQPSAAPISSVDNVTYTLTDNITGNVTASFSAIIIQRDNIIVDGAGYTLQGTQASGSVGMELTGRSNVTVKNMQITAFYCGIYLYSSSNNNVSGNNVTANNNHGIVLDSSSNNIASGNNVTANGNCGIWLYGSLNNVVSRNNVTANSGYGILLDSSSNNTVSGNNATENNFTGIWLASSSNNNTVSGNAATANSEYGILLAYSSNNNTISENNATNSLYGIALTSSSNNTVSRNTATANNYTGVYVYSSSSNTFSGNIVTNSNLGISISSSSDNTFSGNTATANNDGIYLYYSSNNMLYHNNFMNNTSHVYLVSSTNAWDDGYPSGGNFWSDYNGTDLYGGPYQNQTGYDGIGDTTYVIGGSNTDRYPLMDPLSGLGILEVQTLTGSNVSVSPTGNVNVTFANVSTGGFTAWNVVGPPTNQFVSVTCNELRTNASYTGNVTLEFAYDPSGLSLQDEQAMKIWLWNDSSSCWVDVTTYVNTTSDVVYGVSPHLSMFGVTSNLGITGDLGVQGTTTVNLPNNPPAPPFYYMGLNYYQINTTKTLSTPISLRLAYSYQSIQPGQELSVRLMMWNDTSSRWVDITTGVDTTNHVVFGLAPHLSMFGVTCLQSAPGGGGGRMPYMN